MYAMRPAFTVIVKMGTGSPGALRPGTESTAGAVDHFALGIEGFQQSRRARRSPKRNRHRRDWRGERGADRNRLRRHRRDDPLMASREVGEEHQHALAFRLLGFVGQSEHNSFFFPSRDAVGLAVRQQR